MKNVFSNSKSRYALGIILAVAFALFNAIVFAASDMSRAQANFWCGYAFSCLAFALAEILILFTIISWKKTFPRVVGLYVGTMAYLAIALGYGIILICMPDASGWDVKMGMIPEICLLGIYLICIFSAFLINRIDAENGENPHASPLEIGSLANMVYSLEADIPSPSAREEVHRLGKDISYSKQMGNQATVKLEKDFKEQLDHLKDLVFKEADKEEITKVARRARSILRNRNAELKSN